MADTHPPVDLMGFGISNYRSFDAGGFMVRGLKRVNVFIGKNNVGKSNILRAIPLLRQIKQPTHTFKPFDPTLDRHRQSEKPVVVSVVIPSDAVFDDPGWKKERAFRSVRDKIGDDLDVRWNLASGRLEGEHPFAVYTIRELGILFPRVTGLKFTSSWPSDREPYYKEFDKALIGRAIRALRSLDRFLSVPVFRAIRAAGDAPQDWDFNGHNVITRLRQMQHPRVGLEAQRAIFDKIQSFTRDLVEAQDLVLEVPDSPDELVVGMSGVRLPLDSFGTGLHHLVILCAALALHEDHVVSVEEPEVHIHPDLQRKFLRFITTQTNNRYFLTTHSNVFLDAHPDASIYHVTMVDTSSRVEAVTAALRSRAVLTDMGYKASDLLQSNGVIWVEGPSDRVYLNKWLSLVAGDLSEGIHYSIAFYGGKVLAHFCGTDDPVEDLVQVLRINRHAFVLIDRDGADETAKLNASKTRIRAEIGADGCWVTKGREVENYLRQGLVADYLSNRYKRLVPLRLTPNGRLEKAIDRATLGLPAPKIRYSAEKVAYAREFTALMTGADLDVLDLRTQMENLVTRIRGWNHMRLHPAHSAHAPPVS